MSLFSRTKPPLSSTDQELVVEQIRLAEARTTGEIRVFVESHCAYMDAMDRAVEIFANLKMSSTERRNAVLVYVAMKDRQFAVFGDEEIYRQAGGPAFWETAAAELKAQLRAGECGVGIATCVRLLGDALAAHFPFDPTVDKNELPDEIVFGK